MGMLPTHPTQCQEGNTGVRAAEGEDGCAPSSEANKARTSEV